MEKGIDYDREVGRVKISSKEVIPDFNLDKINLAIEVKYTDNNTKTKSIIDQINADILSYSKRYKFIFFIVYDKGTIRDELEFKKDLETMDGTYILIVKH